MKSFIIESIEQVSDAANWILENSKGCRKIAFYGEMGAGKTTVIKSICESLGSFDTVSSPTFSLINEYLINDDEFLYHFDFYRIEKREEVYEFGFEEYLDSDSYCFMEWPEKVEEILPDDILKVNIKVIDNRTREIILS